MRFAKEAYTVQKVRKICSGKLLPRMSKQEYFKEQLIDLWGKVFLFSVPCSFSFNTWTPEILTMRLLIKIKVLPKVLSNYLLYVYKCTNDYRGIWGTTAEDKKIIAQIVFLYFIAKIRICAVVLLKAKLGGDSAMEHDLFSCKFCSVFWDVCKWRYWQQLPNGKAWLLWRGCHHNLWAVERSLRIFFKLFRELWYVIPTGLCHVFS